MKKHNWILEGEAEIVTPGVREEVLKVLNKEGIYICNDIHTPGAQIPIVSMGGKIFAMKIDQELAPERFLESVRIAGPFWGPGT